MRRLRRIILVGLLASVSACAVGPDFKTPPAPKSTGYGKEKLTISGKDQQFLEGRDIPAEWWELYHSKALSAVVRQALRNNPDLASASAALKQAEENVSTQKAAFFPVIQGSFQPTRQKNAADIAPTLASGQPLFNLYTAQLSASWSPDFFGGDRRQLEVLEAQVDYQRFEKEAAYLTLTSNLVAAAIQEASLRAQIGITERLVAIDTEQLALTRRQFELGVAPEINAITQETALMQARATLPPLQKQLAQARDLLTALLGRLPDDAPDEIFTFEDLTLPHDLPVSVPSKLVEQRPDIRAAEAQLHAATAQVGVAVANMLPGITLSATDGTTATRFAQLFMSGTGFWSIAGNATQTLFDAGALLHKKRAASAALEQAEAQYRSTVITAFRNVADSLRALQYDADAVATAMEAERLAKQALEVARRQNALGSTSYLTLLTAEQTYQQAALNLVQMRAARYTDTSVLYQALGGGWWNRLRE